MKKILGFVITFLFVLTAIGISTTKAQTYSSLPYFTLSGIGITDNSAVRRTPIAPIFKFAMTNEVVIDGVIEFDLPGIVPAKKLTVADLGFSKKICGGPWGCELESFALDKKTPTSKGNNAIDVEIFTTRNGTKIRLHNDRFWTLPAGNHEYMLDIAYKKVKTVRRAGTHTLSVTTPTEQGTILFTIK